ncbi:type II toxin-antitoxin system RelE/ParE family toxin [Aliarcobacter skirrowii]|uniref:type II toxin-antitoxin system RelE/ParE family toxin n=1 Tax=Aliarcobacter skirrowii TaxID=28200 RepID=UPI0029A2A702|nr:type II toxin-antitoxin system RelE/ParE family toxin [Aliarcobacter skirrowii]MDX4037608.1 type II toxin-antitoxin system RelE/ParE family toxin [Aliarcobacter skirrowii]
MNIKILEDAQNDIAKAILFYENQKDKLGEYFLDSIMSDIESLYIYYGIHFKVKDYFRVLSKRFPFAIYYKFDKNFIYIYAVLDCRQNPILLNTRLEK